MGEDCCAVHDCMHEMYCAVQVTTTRLMAEARPSAVLDIFRRMSPPQDAELHGGYAKPPMQSPLAKMVGELEAELSPQQQVTLTRHWHRYLERVGQERLRHFVLAQVRCVRQQTAACTVLLLFVLVGSVISWMWVHIIKCNASHCRTSTWPPGSMAAPFS